MNEYWIKSTDETNGPYTKEELAFLAACGTIQPSDTLWEKQSNVIKAANEIPWLMELWSEKDSSDLPQLSIGQEKNPSVPRQISIVDKARIERNNAIGCLAFAVATFTTGLIIVSYFYEYTYLGEPWSVGHTASSIISFIFIVVAKVCLSSDQAIRKKMEEEFQEALAKKNAKKNHYKQEQLTIRRRFVEGLGIYSNELPIFIYVCHGCKSLQLVKESLKCDRCGAQNSYKTSVNLATGSSNIKCRKCRVERIGSTCHCGTFNDAVRFEWWG